MTKCSTEFHELGESWVCPGEATHAEQDEHDPKQEYLICRRCAAIAMHFGFFVRELTQEELNA